MIVLFWVLLHFGGGLFQRIMIFCRLLEILESPKEVFMIPGDFWDSSELLDFSNIFWDSLGFFRDLRDFQRFCDIIILSYSEKFPGGLVLTGGLGAGRGEGDDSVCSYIKLMPAAAGGAAGTFCTCSALFFLLKSSLSFWHQSGLDEVWFWGWIVALLFSLLTSVWEYTCTAILDPLHQVLNLAVPEINLAKSIFHLLGCNTNQMNMLLHKKSRHRVCEPWKGGNFLFALTKLNRIVISFYMNIGTHNVDSNIDQI